MPVSKKLVFIFLLVAFLGFLDATYLTIEHFRGVAPPCTILEGCEQVTTSKYAVVLGVPVALAGSFYYLAVFVLSVLYLQTGKFGFFKLATLATVFGFLFSLWFLYLQLFVIDAICVYCIFSFLTSTALLVLGWVARPVGNGEKI